MTITNLNREDSVVGASPISFGRFRAVVALTALALALFATSARAHDIDATATCSSVTINWTDFASTGSGNGGLNTPSWTVEFTPTGGSPITLNGTVSFPGATFSVTVALPSANGTVTASSAWTAADTRDGNEGPASQSLTISNCQASPPPPPPPPSVPPLAPPVVPSSPVPSQGVAGQSVSGSCPARPSLRGVSQTTRTSISAYVPASGVKRVSFYLDNRVVRTVSKAAGGRFSIKLSTRKLSYGAHRLKAKVTMANSVCASAAVAGTFVRVKAAALRPTFTG